MNKGTLKLATSRSTERQSVHSSGHDAPVALAKLIIDRVATVGKICFANSGTEAIMLAIKFARCHG